MNNVRQSEKHAAQVEVPLVAESPAGHSREQREAERVMLELLSARLSNDPRLLEISLDDGIRVKWAAHALRGFGIQVEVVDLPAEVRAAVRAAQQRQYR